MKKVGIVTVYGEQNYGNKLQNYALVQIYKNLGFVPVTLQGRQSALRLSTKQKGKNLIKAIMAKTHTRSSHAQYYRREESFKAFSRQYLNLSGGFITDNANKACLNSFDILSVGSDQVWNDVDFNKADVEYFSLYGVGGPKKISFAASIGKKDFQSKYLSIFEKGLSDFDFISCREESAVIYLSKILDKECVLLMDPTLFLNADDWKQIEKKPKWLHSLDYCLEYFLGGVNPECRNFISEKTNIIDVMDVNSDAFISSPNEFIYLIHHAKTVLTDSFHACIFSLLFERDFVVFNRLHSLSNMDSRIETLFKEFSVDGKIGETITPDNYTLFRTIVDQKRNEYTNLLLEVLNN
jgi:hypothetical protein